MNGYGSQCATNPTAFTTIHAMTSTLCPTMYCGVPKKRAAFSAPRPKASWPKAPWCCSTRRAYAYAPTERLTRYDAIGTTYATTRREDPRIAALVHAALGDARTVVNVGAGAGSYEPRDRHVIAVEPSDTMAAQRPRDRAPAIRATAERLPL